MAAPKKKSPTVKKASKGLGARMADMSLVPPKKKEK